MAEFGIKRLVLFGDYCTALSAIKTYSRATDQDLGWGSALLNFFCQSFSDLPAALTNFLLLRFSAVLEQQGATLSVGNPMRAHRSAKVQKLLDQDITRKRAAASAAIEAFARPFEEMAALRQRVVLALSEICVVSVLGVDSAARKALMPNSTLHGDANLLVLPNIDAANIAYNLLKTAAGGNIAIGPVLLGAAKPVHVLTASTTVRRIVNMTALTVADANATR